MSAPQTPEPAAAVGATERAAALGIDLALLARTSKVILFGSLGTIAALLVVVAVPVSVAILVKEYDPAPMTTGDLALGTLAAFTVAIVSLVIVQVALRVARRADVAKQQTALSIVESVVEVVGLYVFSLLLREQPGAMIGLLVGSVLRAFIQAAGASSLVIAFKRNSKDVEWMVAQHRSLPKGSTALDYEPSPIVATLGGQALVSIGIVALLWVHPPVVVALTIVVTLVYLATNALIARDAQSGAWSLWGYGAVQLFYLLIAAR